jgi:hypothetical protein
MTSQRTVILRHAYTMIAYCCRSPVRRYNRWWNEEHYGNGQVRRYGNSTSGEYWDATEWMDTYYNPIPHFG